MIVVVIVFLVLLVVFQGGGGACGDGRALAFPQPGLRVTGGPASPANTRCRAHQEMDGSTRVGVWVLREVGV